MTTQTPPDAPTHDTRLAAAPGTWPQADAAWLGQGSSGRTRLAFGIIAVLALSGVAIIARPSGSVAAERGPTGTGAASLPSRHTPEFQLPTPSATLIDAHALAGHGAIPQPPAHDQDGRASLGIIVGPALFVWVYGGSDGVRYSVVDLHGQVMAQGLTASQVYGAFPEINLPEMQFGPDGLLCEPLMWAGEDL